MVDLGGDPNKINPLSPVDLVIDHSVQVDEFGTPQAFAENVKMEFERNGERYRFLRWGQDAFDNFRAGAAGHRHLPSGQSGIPVAGRVDRPTRTGARSPIPTRWSAPTATRRWSTALSVLGWGVGGIEAEAAMLGQPISMLIPEVVGFRLVGKLREGATATDLVLTVTQMLRRRGVVGRFVEYCGPGLAELALADRATIGNMAPEYGATCGFFPIDAETIRYLTMTGARPGAGRAGRGLCQGAGAVARREHAGPGVHRHCSNSIWRRSSRRSPGRAGRRTGWRCRASRPVRRRVAAADRRRRQAARACGSRARITNCSDGDVVIAAITSCTNTSNPSVMLAAGLLAKKAVEKGLKVKPWVKTSLAPGSQVVTDYYEAAGLQSYLDQVGFNLVGYGCTTCIGNSGPLPEPISEAIDEGDLAVCRGAVGQPQFRGPHPRAGARQLSGLAAAGRRLRAGRHDPPRSHDRAARRGQ